MVSAGDRGHPGVMRANTRHISPRSAGCSAAGPSHACRRQQGLARCEIHPAVFRVGFVVLTLLGGAGILIYAAAALVIPDEGKEDSIATAALRNRRDRPWPLIGLGLLAVAGAVLLSRATLWPDGDSWWLFLIAGGVILWLTRTPGAGATDDATELAARDSRRVRRAWARSPSSWHPSSRSRSSQPPSSCRVRRGRQHRRPQVRGPRAGDAATTTGSGSARDIDLKTSSPAGGRRTSARVDVGDLDVIVPADVARESTAEVGEVDAPGGLAPTGATPSAATDRTGRVLVLDAHVGAGSVQVERAVR